MKHDGGPLDSFTIVTTTASAHVTEVHDRMPVLVDNGDHDLWLDPATKDTERLLALLKPRASRDLLLRPVSTYVNNPRNDDPRCIEPS